MLHMVSPQRVAQRRSCTASGHSTQHLQRWWPVAAPSTTSSPTGIQSALWSYTATNHYNCHKSEKRGNQQSHWLICRKWPRSRQLTNSSQTCCKTEGADPSHSNQLKEWWCWHRNLLGHLTLPLSSRLRSNKLCHSRKSYQNRIRLSWDSYFQ